MRRGALLSWEQAQANRQISRSEARECGVPTVTSGSGAAVAARPIGSRGPIFCVDFSKDFAIFCNFLMQQMC